MLSICAAFQVAVPSITRSVPKQQPLFMFSAEDDQVVPTTAKEQRAETEMKTTTEIVTPPKFESQVTERQSGGIDFG